MPPITDSAFKYAKTHSQNCQVILHKTFKAIIQKVFLYQRKKILFPKKLCVSKRFIIYKVTERQMISKITSPSPNFSNMI